MTQEPDLSPCRCPGFANCEQCPIDLDEDRPCDPAVDAVIRESFNSGIEAAVRAVRASYAGPPETMEFLVGIIRKELRR